MPAVRITTNYKEGLNLGDLGYSLLVTGQTVSKGSVFADLYTDTEFLQHFIEEIIDDIEFQTKYSSMKSALIKEEDLERHVKFLKWVWNTLFSFNTLCFVKGSLIDEDYFSKLAIPDKAIQWLESEVDTLKKLNESSEFILIKGTLNLCRLYCRRAESTFYKWKDHPSILMEMRTHPAKFEENFKKCQSFFNRLSSYFYWLGRTLDPSDLQWSSKTEEFPNDI